MNREELLKNIEKLNVPKDAYSLDGAGIGECYVLEKEALGTWVVYYSERGEKVSPKRFKDEEEAQMFFLEKLKKLS